MISFYFFTSECIQQSWNGRIMHVHYWCKTNYQCKSIVILTNQKVCVYYQKITSVSSVCFLKINIHKMDLIKMQLACIGLLPVTLQPSSSFSLTTFWHLCHMFERCMAPFFMGSIMVPISCNEQMHGSLFVWWITIPY